MHLGVDYYPEHWDHSLLEQDLENIAELGCNIIRIGDFAWDIMEKEEGIYDFSFFDEIIEKASQHGLKTMMCVPSATMPNWLYTKYPQIMAKDINGVAQPYGSRRGYCYNSDVYLKKVIALTKAIAKHYKDNKNVVAYQLDNEIGHEGSDMCYCENCQKKFTNYLKRTFKDIGELNQRFGTCFWAQTYKKFEDVKIPRKGHTINNPSLELYWQKFRDESINNYLKTMYDAFKQENPDSLVLHDLEGGTLEKYFDPFKLAKQLDDIAYNNYPVWGGRSEPMKDYEVAFSLDCARGYRNANFWITEEIMGSQGHNYIGCSIKPQQGSCWAIQALAHGCKSFLIFRYRTFNKGAEQFCRGILDVDNRKGQKFHETKQLYHFIKEYEYLWEKPLVNENAILFDYDSACCFRIQPQSNQFNYVNEITRLYHQLYIRDMGCDVIDKTVDFNKYKLLIVPYMIVMNKQTREKLKDYVAKGGKLVLTSRSGWKDEDNNLIFNHDNPYMLEEVIGGCVGEYDSLLDNQRIEVGQTKGYGLIDMLECTSAASIMQYYNNPFGQYTCVSVNAYKLGECYYIGCLLDDETLNNLFNTITKHKIKENSNVETIIRDNHQITIDYDKLTYSIK